MNYKEQLKSPKWQKKRLQIFDLRGFKCESCNNQDKQLHIHHRFYIKGRKAWEYDNDVFQVLCEICHELEHKKECQKNVTIPEKWVKFINQFEKKHSEDFDNLRCLLHGIDTKCNKEDFAYLSNVINSEMSSDLTNIAKKLYVLDKLLWEKTLNS
jgi:hypothetical protein